MNTLYVVVALLFVVIATIAIGVWGLRFSRTTSDFYVASRSVSPTWNSAAISGEYLSAASFFGIAGLVITSGVDMLWYPIGWTVGYLFLLVFVAAPLRRSGAFTIPDFAEWRLQSNAARSTSALVVIIIGWLYLWPQFQGAGLVLFSAIGMPAWIGTIAVAAVVVVNVISGGMRSITFVQAFQYWLKLTALFVPLIFLIGAWSGSDATALFVEEDSWAIPMEDDSLSNIYRTYSLMIATFLGTMGLPHVVVRFYTNPDGKAARRTTLIVLLLISGFYLMPGIYGLIGHAYSERLQQANGDIAIFALPEILIGGRIGELLGAILVAGAFAAFLSTSSGLTMAIAGVAGQQFQSTRWGERFTGVQAIRLAASVFVLVPLGMALLAQPIPVATSVTFAFAMAASTFAPMLVLGIWWRRLTASGAIAGVLAGGFAALSATIATIALRPTGDLAVVLSQPAGLSVPIGFSVMVLVSLMTKPPENTARRMLRLHRPETLGLPPQSANRSAR